MELSMKQMLWYAVLDKKGVAENLGTREDDNSF